MTNEEAVAALDAIDGNTDPEHAHAAADQILTEIAAPEVQAAMRRLVDRARWWAWA